MDSIYHHQIPRLQGFRTPDRQIQPFPRTAFLSESGSIQFSFNAVQTDIDAIINQMLVDDIATPVVLFLVADDIFHYILRELSGMMMWTG
jgi:hypothetical protein